MISYNQYFENEARPAELRSARGYWGYTVNINQNLPTASKLVDPSVNDGNSHITKGNKSLGGLMTNFNFRSQKI